jgi:alpha-tubulin suppressor-like RCC1 family protein
MRHLTLLISVFFLVTACDYTKYNNPCGDGVVDIGEQCDRENHNHSYCQALGFYGGTLSCNDNCTFNVNGCEGYGFCGDNVIQDVNESCDGDNIEDTRCTEIGYPSGTLSCKDNCRFDISGCEGAELCGDGTINDPEQCDGENVGVATCASIEGFEGGELVCGSDCRYDISGCYKEVVCSDGLIHGNEQCDSGNFMDATCDSLGFTGGVLACSECMFDFSSCEGTISCGDGIKNGVEECDQEDLGGNSCESEGFYGGNLTCDENCLISDSNCNIFGFVGIAGGVSHTCGIISTGEAYCWGFNDFGQLGDGTTTDRTVPTPVTQVGIKFSSIIAGDNHTCGITGTGEVYCWGNNSQGQLGDSTNTDHYVPNPVTQEGISFSSITAGSYHTCGITITGEAYCWGNNSSGALGDSTNTERTIPTQVTQGGISFLSINAGGVHTCGITSTGEAYCWGHNGSGQLGDSTTTNYTVPTPVTQGGISFLSINAGGVHTCGITSTGEAYCWGSNDDGRLGDSTTTDHYVPTPVTQGGISFSLIDAGQYHTCGITSTGEAYCWGYNNSGALGDSTNTGHTIPTPVTQGNISFLSINAGSVHTCGISSTGEAYCWGYNGSGQLGDSTTTNRNIPTKVSLHN